MSENHIEECAAAHEDLETKTFDSLFRKQGVPEEAMETIYIIIGSFFFPPGRYDCWNMGLDVFGAGHGKSVLFDCVRELLHPDTFLRIHDLTPAEYFSGQEDLKNKNAILFKGEGKCDPSLTFHRMKETTDIPPFLICTNEPFGEWLGETLRKNVVSIEFKVRVEETDQDPHLSERLKQESDRIKVKCTMAYDSASEKSGKKHFTHVVHPHFTTHSVS